MLAVLGDVNNALPNGARWRIDGNPRPIQIQLAESQCLGAKDCLADLRLTGADQAREADDLAPLHSNRDILEASVSVADRARFKPGWLSLLDAQLDLLGRSGGSDLGLGTDDFADQLREVHGDEVAAVGHAAVAQHGHAIGDLKNLLKAMGDVDDGQPRATHL